MSKECMIFFLLGQLVGVVLWAVEMVVLVGFYAKWEDREIARLDTIIDDLEDEILISEGRPPKNNR
jgi:hypothetical protein